MECNEFVTATEDLRQAAVLDPMSTEIRAMFAVCTERAAASRRAHAEAERRMYKKMF